MIYHRTSSAYDIQISSILITPKSTTNSPTHAVPIVRIFPIYVGEPTRRAATHTDAAV